MFNDWLTRRMMAGAGGKKYIEFADTNVESVIVGRFGDGTGLTYAAAAQITELPYRLFRNNTSIVTFDELEYFTGLTTIAQDCFSGCTNLTSLKLPENITTIGLSAFSGCTSLSIEVYLPNLTSIARGSFYNTGITKVRNLGRVTTIPGASGQATRCFGSCASLTEVVLPSTVTTIEQGAFYNCTSLTTINLPQTITSIGANAFQNDPIAVEINLPNLTTVGDAAFQSTGITRVVNLGTITTISGATNSSAVFNNCSALTSIVFPATITNIGYATIARCPNLASWTVLASTPPTFGAQPDNVFEHIYVPAASVADYKAASGWSSYASIIEAIPS